MTTPIFNPKKAINSVLYIIGKLKKSDMHKISKILYFADMEHLTTYGRPITGDTYIAMDYGPVPSAIYDMFKAVRGVGTSQYKDLAETSIKIKNKILVESLRDPEIKYLSRTDILVIDEMLDRYGDFSWDDIVRISHQYAWAHTLPNQKISIENILAEKYQEQEYIAYISEFIKNQKSAM